MKKSCELKVIRSIRPTGWLMAVSLTLVILLTGCGDPTALPTPTPTPAPPDARAIAKAAADKLNTLNSLHFIVDIKTGQVELYQGITFKNANGDYSKPDKFRARLRVSVAIAQVEAETVGVGGTQWLLLKNLSNNWTQLPPNVGFKADVLFDRDKGLGAVVTKIKDIKLEGTEQLDGVEVYRIRGVVAGADIAPITASTLGRNDVDFQAWIGKTDSLVRQVTFKEISTDKTASDWQLNFSKFDEKVEIKAPV